MLSLTNKQWDRIREHFPEAHIAACTRQVLEGVPRILNTGAHSHMLPQYYPNYKAVHRRFQQWCRDEVLRSVLTDLANDLRDRGAIDERESFIDTTFAGRRVVAKK